MNETYDLILCKGDDTHINWIRFSIRFEENGQVTSHYADMPLAAPLEASASESELISAGLSSLGFGQLTTIRAHAKRQMEIQQDLDDHTKTYFLSVDNARQMMHYERMAAASYARNGGFAFAGHVVDSDSESRLLIQGAVQLAHLALLDGSQQALDQFSASLGNGWRASDGTIVATDAASIVAMGQALAAHIAFCDSISQAHKAAIDNPSATAEEIAAVPVGDGYLDLTSGV